MTASLQRPQYMDVGRDTVRYAVTGEGAPVLLIAGLGANLETWEPVVRALVAHGRRVVTYDGPGIGQSTTPAVPKRMPQLAQLAETLLDRHGIPEADVLGYSLGGLIAQQFAHQAPTRLRKLVLVATSCGIGCVAPPPASVLMTLLSPKRHTSPKVYRETLPGLVGGAVRTDETLVEEYVAARAVQRFDPRGFAQQVYAASTFSSLPWARRLDKPTLVLVGDDDPIIPVRAAEQLKSLLGDATLHVETGAGHLLLMERTEPLVSRIVAFFDQGDGDNGRRKRPA